MFQVRLVKQVVNDDNGAVKYSGREQMTERVFETSKGNWLSTLLLRQEESDITPSSRQQ